MRKMRLFLVNLMVKVTVHLVFAAFVYGALWFGIPLSLIVVLIASNLFLDANWEDLE